MVWLPTKEFELSTLKQINRKEMNINQISPTYFNRK